MAEIDQKFLKQVRILYVEDDEKIRLQMIPLFAKIFKDVIVAVDGIDGLDKYNKGQSSGNIIDVVFTDINMPNMNGISLAREIRKVNKTIVLVFATAHNESAFLSEAIKLHVSHYALKPVNVKETLGYIQEACKVKFEEKIVTNQQKEIEQYLDIINQVAIISKTDLGGNITYANKIFCEVSGYSRSELMGKNHRLVRHPDMPTSAFDNLWQTIKANRVWKGKVKNLSKDGSSYFVDATIMPIKDEVEDKTIGYMAIRFLTDDLDGNKEDMMKKVREDIMKSRKQAFEEKKKVTALEIELELLKKQGGSVSDDQIHLSEAVAREKKKVKILNQQIRSYEVDIKNIDTKVEKATKILQEKNKEMQDRLKTISNEKEDLQNKVISLQTELNKFNK